MPYLSEYEHDVFVSYSHGDPDGQGDSGLKRWSHCLVGALKHAIKGSAAYKNVDIWIDNELDPTGQLTPTLRARVERSALLMIVMTDYYLESLWCTDELGWFEAHIRHRREKVDRFFVVRATPTDPEKWPSCLRDERGHPLPGFRFHRPPRSDDDHVLPFGFPDIVAGNEPFHMAVDELCRWLIFRLRKLREASTPKSASLQDGDARRIYLHYRSDEVPVASPIVKALKERGYGVVEPASSTSGADVQKAAAAERKARLALAKRCGALLLLRPGDADFDLGDALDIGVDERRLIESEAGRPLPTAIVDLGASPGTDLSAFDLARLDGTAPDWLDRFETWLRNCTTGGAS